MVKMQDVALGVVHMSAARITLLDNEEHQDCITADRLAEVVLRVRRYLREKPAAMDFRQYIGEYIVVGERTSVGGIRVMVSRNTAMFTFPS